MVKSPSPIFVFGSNLAGRHGKGAALYARQHHGAIYGQGVGLQGNSYAIPTKDEQLRTLPLDRIKTYVDEFIAFAQAHPEMAFEVTAIGCGLAGYKPSQIAPMFAATPDNCTLPPEFITAPGRHEGGRAVMTAAPTAQDEDNAAIRAEIAARFQAQYDECATWAAQLFGPGWQPSCRQYLVDKLEEDDARKTGRRPSATATVYAVRHAESGTKCHFTVCDGKPVECPSMEAGFGPMLQESHPTLRIEVRGEVVAPHRYSLCWAGYTTYRPKSAEQLAATRARRQEKATERLADANPLFADEIRETNAKPERKGTRR